MIYQEAFRTRRLLISYVLCYTSFKVLKTIFQTTTSQVLQQKMFETIQRNSEEPNLHSSCPPGPTLLITPRIGSNRLLQSEGFLPASTKMLVKVIFSTIKIFCTGSKFASKALHFLLPFFFILHECYLDRIGQTPQLILN